MEKSEFTELAQNFINHIDGLIEARMSKLEKAILENSESIKILKNGIEKTKIEKSS